MQYKLAIIAGDGIGKEVTKELVKVIKVISGNYDLKLSITELPYSADYYLKTGNTITDEELKDLKSKYNAVFLGALGDKRVPDHKHAEDILLGMRFNLDLYVNYRPIKLFNLNHCPLKSVQDVAQVEMAIFRENTQDCYRGIGGILHKDTTQEVVIENSVHTYNGVKRIIKHAFDFADKYNKNSVLMSDKSNVMKSNGYLWQRAFKEIGIQYPHIEKKHLYIDALSMEMIRDPSQFEVIVTSNMFGDIISDLASQLQGGIGLSASVNYNAEEENFLGLFEPIHGSAPNIAGKNQANPLGTILSFVLFLKMIDQNTIAQKIENEVSDMLKENITTIDLGGRKTTTEVGDILCSRLKI